MYHIHQSDAFIFDTLPHLAVKRLRRTLTLQNANVDAFHEVGACPTHEDSSVAKIAVVDKEMAFELSPVRLSFSSDVDPVAPSTAARDNFDAFKKPVDVLGCSVFALDQTGQVNGFVEIDNVSSFKGKTWQYEHKKLLM